MTNKIALTTSAYGRFAILVFIFSMMISSASVYACGSGPCTDGIGQTSEGKWRVRDFTPSAQTSTHVTMSSQSVLKVVIVDTDWAGLPTDVIVTLSDGRKLRVKFEGGTPGADLTAIPLKFLPSQVSDTRPYQFYYKKTYTYSDSKDTLAPFGQTIYSGVTCNLTCKRMMGNFDSVAKLSDGGVLVSGWACDRLQNGSRLVSVRSQGVELARALASLKLADAAKLNKMCVTNVGHRFRIKISKAVADRFRGKPLSVVGFSSGPDLTLPESGKLYVPK
jgi:hypothetical protein